MPTDNSKRMPRRPEDNLQKLIKPPPRDDPPDPRGKNSAIVDVSVYAIYFTDNRSVTTT
jgi:hypothetical protein